jgi:CRISPR-associated protein Cas1
VPAAQERVAERPGDEDTHHRAAAHHDEEEVRDDLGHVVLAVDELDPERLDPGEEVVAACSRDDEHDVGPHGEHVAHRSEEPHTRIGTPDEPRVGAHPALERETLRVGAIAGPRVGAIAGLREATTIESLMSVEGNFRRTSWAALDELLPPWLRLQGRSRRPPANAGNAFISFVNGIVYARVLTAIRTTPLHPSVSFLDAIDSRQRYPLALDLAEPFRPLFAERLILRSASRRVLQPSDFEQDVASAALSAQGRKKVVTLVRDELDGTVYHRSLRRKVTYAELMHLEALKLVRLLLEGAPYRAFHPWW